MAEINVTKKMKDKHLKYWENNILPKLNQLDSIRRLNDYIKQKTSDKKYKKCKKDYKKYLDMISCILQNYHKLAVGDVDELKGLYEDIKKLEQGIVEWSCYSKLIINLLGYEKFSSIGYNKNEIAQFNKNDEITRWSPYTLIKLSGVKNCPYCNRQYISPLYTKKGKLRPDLDHFLPKSVYPCFSMSLYNLVPVCKFCNSSLKLSKDFTFESANPFVDSFNDILKFDLEFTSNVNDTILKVLPVNKKAVKFIEEMMIEEQYKLHLDVALDLIRKSLMYPEELLNRMKGGMKIQNYELFKEDLFGYISDNKICKDTPLGKFKTDLAQSLGLYKK